MSNGAAVAAPPNIPSLRLQFLWREALGIIALLVLMALGSTTTMLMVCAILLLWSLRSCAAAVQSLSLLVPISTLSWDFSSVEFSGMFKWMIIFVASGSAVYHCVRSHAGAPDARGGQGLVLPRWLLAFGLFLLMIAMLAVVSSTSTELSIFKLLTFAVGVIGAMAAFWDRRLSMAYCLSWLFTIHVVVLGISLLLIPSGIAWYPRTTYFMGILNQSQAMGIYLVPFTTFLLIKWLTDRTHMTLLEMAACLGGMAGIFLTNSRTSGSSVLFTLILLLLVGLFRSTPEHEVFRRRFLPAAFLLILVLFVLDSLTQGGLARRIEGFVMKGGVEVTSVLATREEKFNEAEYAFRTHRWTGVGFGMNLGKEEIQVKRDPFFNLPITAPVEAGVMYMAMPAQIGLIGLVPFFIFMFAFGMPIARDGPLPIFGMALGGLLTNAGEYTFFSIGGMGLFLWIMFAFAHRFSAVTGHAGDY